MTILSHTWAAQEALGYGHQKHAEGDARVRFEAMTHIARIFSSDSTASRLARPLLLVLAVLVVIGTVAPSGATARVTRSYQNSFGSFGRENPSRLAVDQSNGDLYALRDVSAGGGTSTLSRFDDSGAPKNFTAGPDAGTNALKFPYPDESPGAIAFDNSGGPLDGDFYVSMGVPAPTHGSIDVIKIFDSNGESLGVLDGSVTSKEGFGAVCGVATDPSNGDLYIAQATNGLHRPRIWRYSPSSPTGSIDDSDYTVTGVAANVDGRCGLAVSSGNVYFIGFEAALYETTTSMFSATVPTLPEADPILRGATALSADPATGEVYVDLGSQVTVLDPASDAPDFPVYSFGLGPFFTNSTAVEVRSAVSGSAPKVYVADREGGEIDIFGPKVNVPVSSHLSLPSFGKDGTNASSFSNLDQLAFEQGDRKLFALDRGLPGIYGFNALAPPAFPTLTGFAPLGTAAAGEIPDLAVDNSGLASDGNVYFVSQATDLLYGFDAAGVPLGGGFPVDPAISPGAPDGSPKDLCGVAVDSAGNIWVANSLSERILEYSPSGVSLPGVVHTSMQGSPCRLAFDSNDNLYVSGNFGSSLWRYSAASSYTSATAIGSQDFTTASRRVDLTVDPSDDHLYVAHPSSVDEWDATGDFVERIDPGIDDIRGVALDASSGTIYVAEAGKVHAFGPDTLLPDLASVPATDVTNTSAVLKGSVGAQGLAVNDCHFEYVTEAAFRVGGFSDLASDGSVPCSPVASSVPVDTDLHQVSATVSNLARSTSYRYRLVAANANGQSVSADLDFETIGPPLVETTGSPVRSTTTARLDSRVDPRGDEATYHFEYGTEGPCDANPCISTQPQPAGSGDEFELVSQQLAGLTANTTYHYRVMAENGNPDGLVAGGDMTLTTFAEEAPLSHGYLPGPVGSDRAWELVSAPDTGGNPVGGFLVPSAVSISDAADRAIYSVAGGTPDSETGTAGTRLFAERTPSGWHTKNIYPSRDEATGAEWLNPGGPSDLSELVAENFPGSGFGEFSVWRIKPNDPPARLYSAPDKTTTRGGGFLGVSDDGSRVLNSLLGTQDPTHPAVEGTRNLYDISSEPPRLISLLPDDTVSPCGVVQGANSTGMPETASRSSHWVSADGSLAYFPSLGNPCAKQQIYLRDFAAETTKSISSPVLSGLECEANFIKSIPGAAFFYTQSRLVGEDSEPKKCEIPGLADDGDVYRYDVGNGGLDCITCAVPGVDAGVTFSNNANQVGTQIGVADDGSRVYFTSSKRLVPGAPTKGGVYRLSVEGSDLAYVGAFGFIGDTDNSVMSADGSVVAFQSADPSLNALGGQQNGGEGQYYLYDDRDRSLVCVSCPADGSTPVGASTPAVGGLEFATLGSNIGPLSEDGGIFAFSTPTPLTAADQNTARAGQKPAVGADVYEWRRGRLLLVSDGLTNWPGEDVSPRVAGISPSGHDIFFTAAIQYTADALDGYKRLYDARIGGGFEFPQPPKPCPLEVCQGTPKGAPEEAVPGTSTIVGSRNAADHAARVTCRKPKRKVRQGGRTRCVKPVPRKPRHKRASHDRRTAR